MTNEVRCGATFPGHRVRRITRDELDLWVGRVVELGYDHIAMADHVVGIDHGRLSSDEHERWAKEWQGPPGSSPYTNDAIFLEPFVIFGYLAARCDLELVTACLVLPQRETALVAKQAAAIDYLTGGKLRLCIGTGWNSLECAALGFDFASRGKRTDEQIEVLHKLWTEDTIDYDGSFHQIRAAGIQSLPARPIPIWGAGERRKALERAGRLTDGWLPPLSITPGEVATTSMAVIRQAAIDAGRDPEALGVEPTIYPVLSEDGDMKEFVAAWRRQGATHFLVNTGGQEGMTLSEHIDQLERASRVLELR